MLDHNLPFANLNNDFYAYSLRVLILLKHLDRRKKSSKPTLNLRRLFLYDYLINRPFLLKTILHRVGSENLIILEYEKTDIRRQNLQSFMDNHRLEIVLNALISAEMVVSDFSNDLGLVFFHTARGNAILQTIRTNFIERLEERAIAMHRLQSKSDFLLATEINKIHKDF